MLEYNPCSGVDMEDSGGTCSQVSVSRGRWGKVEQTFENWALILQNVVQ